MADGQYKFSIGLDDKQLEMDIAQAKKAFDSLVKQAQQAGAKIDKMPNPFENIGQNASQVAQATQQFNGLNMATQQLVRELPAASMGINTFFMAISNNLPIFADQVKNLRQQGTSVAGVLKGIGTALFSWQTALVLGVTALSMYGKEIGAWISSLFKGKEAVDALKEAQNGLNEEIAKNGLGIGKEIGKYESLRREFEAINGDLKEQERFVRDNQSAFDDLGVSVYSVVDAEAFFSGEGTEAFLKALRLRAEALAAQKLAVEKYEDALILEAKASELPEFVKTKPGAMVQTSSAFPLLGVEGSFVPAGEMAYNAERKELEAEAEAARSVADAYFDMSDAKMKASGDALKGAKIKQNDQQTQAELRAIELRMKQIAEASARLRADAERATSQAEVDAMKEGINKKIAQINLNYDLEEQAITKREEELKKLRGGRLTSDEQKAIDAMRKANASERDRNTQAAYDALFAEADAWLKESNSEVEEMGEALNKELARRTKAWEDYFLKYGTIKERLLAVTTKYNRLINDAETEAERMSLEAERDTILAQYEVEASAWAKELVGKTREQLNTMIDELTAEVKAKEEAFNALDSSTGEDAANYRKQIATLNAQIAMLKQQLGEADEAVSSNNWAESAQVFQGIASAASEMADSLEGVDDGAAKTLRTMAQFASVAGNLVLAIDAVIGATTAMQTALGVIGLIAAAISAVALLVQTISNSRADEAVLQFKELNKEIERMHELAKIDNWGDTIFGKDAFGNFSNNLRQLGDAVDALEKSRDAIINRGWEDETMINHENALILRKGSWADVEDSLKNMKVKTKDRGKFAEAFGARDQYSTLGEMLPSLFGDDGVTLKGLQELKNSDVWGKLSQVNRDLIDEMIADWELYEEALEATTAYMQDIFGDLGASITDSLVDAFRNGTDAAIAMGDAVSGVIEQIATDLAHSAFIQPLLDEANKAIEALNERKGREGLTNEEYMSELIGITSNLMDESLAQGEDLKLYLENLQRIAEEKGIDTFNSDSSRSSSRSGIAQASQDSIDELNGRMTAIQSHTYSIMEYQRQLTRDTAAALRHLSGIEINTHELYGIRGEMAKMRKDISDIATRGIIIR